MHGRGGMGWSLWVWSPRIALWHYGQHGSVTARCELWEPPQGQGGLLSLGGQRDRSQPQRLCQGREGARCSSAPHGPCRCAWGTCEEKRRLLLQNSPLSYPARKGGCPLQHREGGTGTGGEAPQLLVPKRGDRGGGEGTTRCWPGRVTRGHLQTPPGTSPVPVPNPELGHLAGVRGGPMPGAAPPPRTRHTAPSTSPAQPESASLAQGGESTHGARSSLGPGPGPGRA